MRNQNNLFPPINHIYTNVPWSAEAFIYSLYLESKDISTDFDMMERRRVYQISERNLEIAKKKKKQLLIRNLRCGVAVRAGQFALVLRTSGNP